MSRNMANGRLAAASEGGRGLPLFPNVEALSPFGRLGDTLSLFEDPLLGGLIESRSPTAPAYRLSGSRRRMQSRNRHNRYEPVSASHGWRFSTPGNETSPSATPAFSRRRVDMMSAMAHSHSLEPVFRSRFGISHHEAGFQIIRGESSLGREIPEVLAPRP